MNYDDEIWKDVEGFEGLYQISNLGRAKRLSRSINPPNGGTAIIKERILTASFVKGYPRVVFSKNNKMIDQKIHRLIACAFIPKIDGKPFVNHKNGIRSDNRLENLEWVNYRENNSCRNGHSNKTSAYVGVSLCANGKWKAQIKINQKVKCLGTFVLEEEARIAYSSALKENKLTNTYANV